MIENSDPITFILITFTLMSAIIMVGFGAVLWVVLNKYRSTIAQLQQDNYELRQTIQQYSSKVRRKK
jgi:hypothetical protein